MSEKRPSSDMTSMDMDITSDSDGEAAGTALSDTACARASPSPCSGAAGGSSSTVGNDAAPEVDAASSHAGKSKIASVELVGKKAYEAGLSDGQKILFASSYRKGFTQGISFGLALGMNYEELRDPKNEHLLKDINKYNCQVCLDESLLDGTVAHIHAHQEHMNEKLLVELKKRMN